MIIYDRPFITYEKQLETLETKYSLNINKTKFEIDVLSSLSYYDLINGYKDCFMKNEKYEEGMSKEFLVQFLIFDKNFQTILFKYSVYTETSFKTRLAYAIAKKMCVDENNYLDIANYKTLLDEKEKMKLISLLGNIKNECERTKDNPTKHYRNNHNHIPPWILFKNITFNDTIDLYGFLKSDIKKEIVEGYFENSKLSYEGNAEVFKNMITIVRKFRNKIAHNSKMISYKVKSRYELKMQKLIKVVPKEIYNSKDIKEKRGSNDIYAMIISLIELIGNNYLILSFIKELKFLFSPENQISAEYIKQTNLPENLFERLENLEKYYTIKFEKDIYTQIEF